jgi:hypothetical protein
MFDVASRWLADDLHPGDGRTVTEIFIFERIITAPIVRGLVGELLAASGQGPLWMERVVTKDDVRHAITARLPVSTPRSRGLLEEYRQRSEEFFPRTPVNMTVVTRGDGTLVGMIRRKRLQRIAEKVSRRMSEMLAGTIDETARALASGRARAAGLPLQDLLTNSETMAREFEAAEQIVAERIRGGEIRFQPDSLSVHDVIGVKLVLTEHEIARVESLLADRNDLRIQRRKIHDGLYAGTHLLVDVDLPPVAAIAETVRSVDWSFADGRGLSPHSLEMDFYEYLEGGDKDFRIELILTTPEDLVESEFGRCVHEVRILEQRSKIHYSGRIAENASNIIEYLLQVAISPTVEVAELPIKIWGRYLRDTLTHSLEQLRGDDRPEWLLPASPPGRQALSPAGRPSESKVEG